MSMIGSNENRKRNRSHIDDKNESSLTKEPHYSRSMIGNLDSNQETSRIRTLSSQSVYIPHSSVVPHLDSFMPKHRHSLKDALFSPKISYAFRNDSGSTNGIRGLYNLGNTCYMNAAIQALSNCPPLRDYFCLLNVDSNLSASNANADVSSAFRDLLMRIWSEYSQVPIKPTNFLFQVRTKCPQFRGFSQQDSQEFIRCFLDVIHQELKYPIGHGFKPLLSPSTLSTASSGNDDANSDGVDTVDSGMSTENESPNSAKTSARTYEQSEKHENEANCSAAENNLASVEENTETDGNNKEKSNDEKDKPSSSNKKVNYESVVSVVFDGQLISTVKCLTCQHLSHTNETFQDISLSIPTIEQLEKMKEALEDSDPSKMHPADISNEPSYFSWLYGFTNRWFFQPWFSWVSNFYRYVFYGSVTLEDCLCAFFAADHLRGEDMYSCEKCAKLRNGVKQCRLKSLPEVLCIHLKRFRHDTLYNTKINTKITFPLRELDLQPYMDIQENSDNQNEEQNYVYDLIGIVSHRGSSVDFGHYIAYCINQADGLWYEFDDAYVRQVSEAEVNSIEAYVLFYQKRSLYALDEVDDF
ncbi:Ubiquitin carboxyl-terminal hydrolase 33 [Aphelenchoides bicaudatus]|nr:Ubiquitin carboxyl-terminal hydrolase 33 [Aphelenchoides bicaudatus]